MKNDVSFYVVKSNEMIRKLKMGTNLEAQKILAFLIAQVRSDAKDVGDITFDIKDYCIAAGINYKLPNNITYVKQSLKTLADKSSCWYQYGNKEILVRLLDKVEVNMYESSITISFSEFIKPHIIRLSKNYTTARLKTMMEFKRKHSLRLYEYCKSYAYLGKIEVSVNEIKSVLNVEKNYKSYGDFKRFCLKPAIEEIICGSEIFVVMKELKKGRSVDRLLFEISDNEPFMY